MTAEVEATLRPVVPTASITKCALTAVLGVVPQKDELRGIIHSA